MDSSSHDFRAARGGAPPPARAAILLDTLSFEDFFGAQLGLSHERYLTSYRNDWSWDWCSILRAHGVCAGIYVASNEYDRREEVEAGQLVRFLRLGREFAPWRRYPVLRRSPLGRYVAEVANAIALIEPLRQALADDRIDVLLVQSYWTGRYDFLTRALDLPLIAVDQGMEDRHELKFAKRRSLCRARVVLTQTEAESRKVRRYGGRPARVQNAVDTEFFTPSAPPSGDDRKVILNVARLDDAQKRQSDLIRAMRELGHEWQLELVGDGPDRGRLEQLADEVGVRERVRFAGLVLDRVELRERYRSCAVFALPSLFEGLPMALLEAMSCGASIVGSTIAAIAEVVADGSEAVLVEPRDPRALAEAIERADAAREARGRAARVAAERRFSSASVGTRLAQLVRDAAVSP